MIIEIGSITAPSVHRLGRQEYRTDTNTDTQQLGPAFANACSGAIQQTRAADDEAQPVSNM
jgi:hypothetical protein